MPGAIHHCSLLYPMHRVRIRFPRGKHLGYERLWLRFSCAGRGVYRKAANRSIFRSVTQPAQGAQCEIGSSLNGVLTVGRKHRYNMHEMLVSL